MTGVVWRVEIDRYSRESEAKSGYACSLLDTVDCFMNEYERFHKNNGNYPEVEVIDVGIGIAFSAALEAKGVPFSRVDGLIMRIPGADILKTKKRQPNEIRKTGY